MLGVKLCVRDKKEAICVVYPIRSQVPWLAIIGSCNASVVLVCLSCSCYSIKTVGVGTLFESHYTWFITKIYIYYTLLLNLHYSSQFPFVLTLLSIFYSTATAC